VADREKHDSGENISAREAPTAAGIPVQSGATWITDAPFRETEEAIDAARNVGILAVEMEAAALYAFAEARNCVVLCFAHVTNQMGRIEETLKKASQMEPRIRLR